MNNYLIIIEKQKNNYSAYSPDLSGCIATGKTVREVKKNMKEAIDFHIEGLKLSNLKIPTPKADFYYNEDTTLSEVINFRCTQTLHNKLLKLASKEKVSVSHLVNDAIVKAYS